MILLDSNVVMYAAGAAHPCKEPSLRLLERIAAGEVAAAVDAELHQEVMHRYRSMGRWAEGRRLLQLVEQVLPRVLPVTGEVMRRAAELLDAYPSLLARDAVHAAVVFEEGLAALCSYDRDFDVVRGLRRVEP